MINWQTFHFIRPEWLFAIIPLLMLVIFLSRISNKRSGWQSIVSSHLYQHLVVAKDKKSRKPPFYLIGLAWLVACIAMAGPTWQKLPQPVYQVSTGKVVVLDMSLSMRATDLQPDRLSRAKFKTIDLLNSLNDGEVGLVVYAGDAFTVSPLTADVTNITTLIPSLRPEIMPIPGSQPIFALEEAEKLLSSAGYAKGEVYWISDGIELDDIEELQKHISNSPYRYSVLGVGTEAGAPIKMLDGSFMKDASGNIILPALISRYFEQVLANSNARYTPIQNDDSDIKNMQFTPIVIEDEQVSNDIIGQGDQWKDMGAFLVLLILPFAAYAFRRGVLAILLCSFLLFPTENTLAAAEPSAGKEPSVGNSSAPQWYNKAFKNADQQGLEAFKQEDFDTASAAFDDVMWQGAALYKNKNYEAALTAFEQVPGAESNYNQGNTLAKLGKLEEAIEKYNVALSINPEHENAELNKKLVEELLKQQQEQEQQEQNQDSDQQSSDNQQSGDSDKNEQQSDENSQQSNEQQKNQQQDSSSSDDQQQNPEQTEAQQKEQDKSQNSDQQSSEETEQEKPQAEQTDSQENPEATEQKSTMQQQKPFEEMTPEEKEQMQRMQMLMNKVPDDPAYLLQRKMLLESQQRRNERFSKPNKKDW